MDPRFSPDKRGTCQVCAGPARDGRSFYCELHRPEQKPPTRKPKSRGQKLSSVVNVKSGPQGIIRELGNAAPESLKKSPPSAGEWGKALGKVTGTLSILAVSAMIGWDIPDEMAADLSLSDSAGESLMKPLGRIIAKSSFSKKSGRDIIENLDLVDAATELAFWGRKVNRYAKVRREGFDPVMAWRMERNGQNFDTVKAQAQAQEVVS